MSERPPTPSRPDARLWVGPLEHRPLEPGPGFFDRRVVHAWEQDGRKYGCWHWKGSMTSAERQALLPATSGD
jgi:hypothetical protein